MKQTYKTCMHCSSEFESQRSDAKFCSNSCRTMYSREKANQKPKTIEIEFEVNEFEYLISKAVANKMRVEEYVQHKSLIRKLDFTDMQSQIEELKDENKRLRVELDCNSDEAIANPNVISLHFTEYERKKLLKDFISIFRKEPENLEVAMKYLLLNIENVFIDMYLRYSKY